MTFPRKAVKKAVRIRFAFHQPFMLQVKKPVKSRLFRVSWWCGVDLSDLSPKPRAEGSSPSAPARFQKALDFSGVFCYFHQPYTFFTRLAFDDKIATDS